MDIGAVLSRAWEIIWKHKILWIFGILAGCATGANSGGSNFRYTFQNNRMPGMENFFNQIPEWQIAVLVGLVILIGLVLIVIAVFLGTIGRIGLIRGTLQAEQGSTRLTFGELFNGSLPYFWRVFLLNLLVGLAVAVAFTLIVLLGVFGAILTLGVGLLCLIPLICVLVPITWFISVIVTQANIAIVAENKGVMDGLQRGWEVVKNNLGMMIVMALILMVGISLVGGFIIGLPLAIVVGPAVLGMIVGTGRAAAGGLLVAGLCLVLYLPVWILLFGILRSYIETAWTLTYLRLTDHPAVLEPTPTPTQV